MAEIIWTTPALANLDDTVEYIALSNFLAAKNLVTKIFDKVERLEDFPESGKKPIELSISAKKYKSTELYEVFGSWEGLFVHLKTS